MNDLVKRLRSGEDGLEYAAADEIERLQAQIADIESHLDDALRAIDRAMLEVRK